MLYLAAPTCSSKANFEAKEAYKRRGALLALAVVAEDMKKLGRLVGSGRLVDRLVN